MAALSVLRLSAKQSSMARPAWRQAPPMARPSASWRAAAAVADSRPSWSQPARITSRGTMSSGRRDMAKPGMDEPLSAAPARYLSAAPRRRPGRQSARHGEKARDALLRGLVGRKPARDATTRQRVHDHHL